MTLTVQQCAQQISVVPHSIRKWIWAGKLPAKKVLKGREQWTYLVNAEDWQRFVEEREKGPLPDVKPMPASPPRASHSHIYFETNDPDDRLVKQAALMKQALNGCRASREQLRAEPFRLTYWMAVDGAER